MLVRAGLYDINIKMQLGYHIGTVNEGLYFSENFIKKYKIKDKDNKISHGKGNSLRNKVRGWVEIEWIEPSIDYENKRMKILRKSFLTGPTLS